MIKYLCRAVSTIILVGVLAGCSGMLPTSVSENVQSEASYCTVGSISLSGTPVTITGLSANYTYYATIATALGANLAGSTSTRGIPYAEVAIRNSNGDIVQCAETNASGVIGDFQIPKVPGTYTVTVFSRAHNSKIKVSVLNDINANVPYSVNTTFNITGSEGATKTVNSTITAYGTTSNREGAAFHILYNIYLANEYLRTELSNPSFTTDKVTVYWKNGFNPGSYVGTSNMLSYYIQGSRELYILGGSGGNSSTADTDHFDDSVILHEFAHFLEDVYSRSDSQGGSHNGDFIIDPRLAWSEGWANFFQGAVIRTVDATRGRYYIDTVAGSSLIRFDLGANGTTTSKDRVSLAGEGTFREVSVSRTLWKTIAPAAAPASPAGAEVPFLAIWQVFTDSVNGLKNPLNVFRNIGMFNLYLDAKINSNYASKVSAWDAILANEKQNTTTKDYANPVTSAMTCAVYPKAIDPVDDLFYGSEARSHQLRSNDFYLYYHSGGSASIILTYATTLQSTDNKDIDLDLYIYKNNYIYQEDELEASGQTTGGVAVKSDRIHGVTENGTESVSLNSLSPGYYLINVKANTYNKNTTDVNGTATYTLQLNNGSTSYLCPQYN